MASPQNLIVAALDGTARRVLQADAPRGQAIAELHSVTTDPVFLAQAAGTALGAWRANAVAAWQGQHIAELLLEAGADPGVVEEVAATTAAAMARRNTHGS